MSTRVNPFANLADPPVFATKPRKEKPVEEETIARIAEDNNFPSAGKPRKPPKELRRKGRVYRTGRNQAIQHQGDSRDHREVLQDGGRSAERSAMRSCCELGTRCARKGRGTVAGGSEKAGPFRT